VNSVSTKKLKTPTPWFKQVLYLDLVNRPQFSP